MEIYQLRAHVTVAKIGHLTRAAEVLHLTQPAVTGQIKALEEELGIALFDRRPGRIMLTRAGERLLPEAEQVLTAAGALLGGLLAALPLLGIKTRMGAAEDLHEAVATSALQASFYIGPNIPRDVMGLALQTIQFRVVAPFSFSQRVLHAGWREIADMPWIAAPP